MNAISHNFVVASTYPLSDLIACRSRILDLMHRVSDGVGNLLMPALDEIELEIAATPAASQQEIESKLAFLADATREVYRPDLEEVMSATLMADKLRSAKAA